MVRGSPEELLSPPVLSLPVLLLSLVELSPPELLPLSLLEQAARANTMLIAMSIARILRNFFIMILPFILPEFLRLIAYDNPQAGNHQKVTNLTVSRPGGSGCPQ
jgi:hypothetical protein